jgi:serine/threonine protein phosphatase PrpC
MSTPAKGGLHVQIGHASARGPREANEDFVAACLEEKGRQHGVVAAIADGVGGAKGGRIAAELTVRAFIDGYSSQSETQSVRRSAGQALHAINGWICAQGRTDGALEGMACTLTAAILRGRRLHAFHVGDTRLYRLRGVTLALLTRDHRPELPAIRNQLTRAIGAEDDVRIDYIDEALEAHDRLLLCSDGVHDVLSDRRIEEELMHRTDPQQTARSLVDAALTGGGGDNATALVIDVLGLPEMQVDDISDSLKKLPIIAPPAVGAVIDDFELAEVLADGRYSRVFAASDRRTSSKVLIKFPKPMDVGAEASARGAFLRESWVASRVNSPWVGAVMDLPPERRTCLYLVQPFYEGETLERRLQRRPPVSLEQGLDIAQKLAKAVAALHRAGIIHCDIKPENVILERDGGVKLVDLGVARLPHLETWPLTENPGTPSYMAPEMFAGASGDERSDLFALGVTLYRMFAGGAYPYGEIEPFTHPRFRNPTSLAVHRPNLPAWLDAVLTRALAAAPEERIQDAIELSFELEQGAVKGAPAHALETSLYDRNPLLFWQVATILLVFALIASLTLH